MVEKLTVIARFKIEASNGLFNSSGKTVMMSILITVKMHTLG